MNIQRTGLDLVHFVVEVKMSQIIPVCRNQKKGYTCLTTTEIEQNNYEKLLTEELIIMDIRNYKKL